MDNFITPENHFGFKAKKVTEEIKGTISDSSIAYIEPQGGGPEPSHTHIHDHFFYSCRRYSNNKNGRRESQG